MNLADKAKADKKSRVPFILMGNDFDNLYDPLTRDGRMDFFFWNPDVDEKIRIISENFQDIILPEEMCVVKDIVRNNANQPVSFFTEIKNDYYKQIVSQHIAEQRDKNANRLLSSLNSSVFSRGYIPAAKLSPFVQKRLEQQAQRTPHEERSGLHNA